MEGGEDPWDFGDTNDYPVLKVDFNGDDDATWQEFGGQHTVPDPPVLTAVVGSANQFTVNWSAPVADGRSDVIAYGVRYILTNSDPSSDANWIVVESAWTVGPFAYTVTGLGNGLEYGAEVRAVNAIGASPWSNPGNDYDIDDDNLIEIDSLARLNAVRWDLDGNGASDLDAGESRYLANRAGYLAAFPNGAPRMGCPAVACDGYELTADLDFDTDRSGDANSGDEYWNGGAGWEPIGWFDDGRIVIEFHGTLDGNHHAISNLFLDRPYLLYDGLIGYVGASGVVRDLGLMGTDVSANIYVGGLAGINAGSIHAVRVSGSVHGVFDVGGLVGRNQGSVSGSYARVNASGDDTVGGVVGFNDGGDIATSYSAGDVNGRQILGGLVGYNEGDISASYSASIVTATGKSAGGLVGRNHRRTDGTHGAIGSSYSTGRVTGATEVGGLVGIDEATITDSYWNTETSGQPASAGGEGKTTAQLTGPTDTTGIYASWNSGETATWNFGAGDQYPVLVVDLDGNGGATWQEFGDQRSLTPPGAPTIKSFTGAPGQLTVAWSAPENDGGGEIMSYLVRYILSSRDQTVNDNWTVVYGAWTSGALEYTVTGLEFDAGKYTMQVKAANQRFAGEWSAAESVFTIVAPILTVSDSEPAPGEKVDITATLRQPDSGADYQWQRLFRLWRDVGPESSTKRVIFDSAGTRIYRAVVTLSNGDIVRSAPLSLTWE